MCSSSFQCERCIARVDGLSAVSPKTTERGENRRPAQTLIMVATPRRLFSGSRRCLGVSSRVLSGLLNEVHDRTVRRMKEMRVVEMSRFGGPEVLEVTRSVVPEPDRTEVLIRVVAAGVNPVDWYLRQGGPSPKPLDHPLRLGWEVAGVVETVGPGVTLWEVGDPVMGVIRYPHQAGAYADYVVAPARQLARVPAGIDLLDAGGVPFGGLTAWQALHDVALVQRGENVMINAANGGVGHLAVQIAVALGATVTAIARADVHSFVGSLGATDVVDVGESVGRAHHDVVVDLLGGEEQSSLLDAIRPGGRLVMLADDPSPETLVRASERGIRVVAPIVEPDRQGMVMLSSMMANGRLRPHVGLALELEAVAEAHRVGESRANRTGKIVLSVQ